MFFNICHVKQRTMRVSAVLLCLLATVISPVKANETSVFRDWAVECDSAPAYCVASQVASAQEGGLWLGTLRLRPAEGGGADVMVVVPAGVHLASGLFVGVRQPLTQVPFQRCTASACTAAGRIDQAELTRWRRGNAAQLRYRPSMGAPPVAFPVSLMGISAALRHVREKES